jgi:hypothetical protein
MSTALEPEARWDAELERRGVAAVAAALAAPVSAWVGVRSSACSSRTGWGAKEAGAAAKWAQDFRGFADRMQDTGTRCPFAPDINLLCYGQ